MKNRKYVRVCLSLYPEDIEDLNEICSYYGFSMSAAIRFLIKAEKKRLYYKKLHE